MFDQRSARRPLVVSLLVAVIVHLPILPTALSMLLLGGMARDNHPLEPLSDTVTIPVELDFGLADERALPDAAIAEPAPQGDKPSSEVSMALPPEEPKKKRAKKANKRKKIKKKKAKKEGKEPDKASEVSRRPVRGPAALAGGAAKVSAKTSNIRIYLAMDMVRKHPLGPRFGRLLARVPQWKVLLGGSGIDPLKHFDHMSLSGPHMRNTRAVVTVADFNVSVAKMQNAIDAVVRRSGKKGRWLPGSVRKPIAVVGPRGEHQVHVLKKKRLLAVVPTRAKVSRAHVERLQRFSANRRVVAGVYLRSPWRAFRRVAFINMPKRIKWLRVRLVPESTGGFLLEADAKSVSEQAARADAASLSAQIEAFRSSLWLLKNRYFGSPSFDTKGDVIRVTARLSAVQAQRIVGLAEGQLDLAMQRRQGRNKKRP